MRRAAVERFTELRLGVALTHLTGSFGDVGPRWVTRVSRRSGLVKRVRQEIDELEAIYQEAAAAGVI